MIVTSVQIKTVKTQKHLYCPVFTKDTEVFSLVSFLFVCNFSPGRDENATVHLFAQHSPPFQVKAENPGTGVPGKQK